MRTRFRPARPVVVLAFALAFVARPAATQRSASQCPAPALPTPGPLLNPPEIASRGGVLNVAMKAAPGSYRIGDSTYTNNLYAVNEYPGLYAPPTLRLNPGDSVSLVLSNLMNPPLLDRKNPGDSLRLARGHLMSPPTRWTNLHYHGFNVTPVPPGDNVVFVAVNPGQSFRYGFRLPDWHPTGMFWYHPHPHGISEPQVLGGMSGAIIVDGLLDANPQWKGIPERVMLLKDFLNPCGDTLPKLKTINGQSYSSITVAANEPQLWHIGNVGADAYFNLKVRGLGAGAMPFRIIARDGNPTEEPIPADSLFLAPSSRVEAIVALPPGEYELYSDFVSTGPAGDPNPRVPLARVISASGAARAARPARAAPGSVPADSAAARLARIRDVYEKLKRGQVQVDTIVFSEDPVANTFTIDGRMYDPNRIDKSVEVPSVRAWLIQNASPELHVFHIHQTDFAVVQVNGVPQPLDGFVDSVNLPFQVGDNPGEVLVLIDFGAEAAGEFVYHCHILQHEDLGMMANIYAYPAGTAPAPRARTDMGRHRHR